MKPRGHLVIAICLTIDLLAFVTGCGAKPAAIAESESPRSIATVPGMPPVVNPSNLYSEAGPNMLSSAVSGALSRVYVPNVKSNDVYVIDPATDKVVDHFKVGKNPQHVVPAGTHGLYPSRDATKLYITNRGSHKVHGAAKGPGNISVLDFATRKIVATWPIVGGGSPDMGNVSADGKRFWVAGRFDQVVYVFDTTTGAVKQIPVGKEPHGLTVWPQPGRCSDTLEICDSFEVS